MTELPSEPVILIATALREQGTTGVQTYFNTLLEFLLGQGKKVAIVTPFSFHHWLVTPVFAIRKVIDSVNGELSVWWYRHWHYYFLKLVLHRQLQQLAQQQIPVLIYAQEPLAAKAALMVRQSADQKVVMIVHFNISQADEWVGKGKIAKQSWVYQDIQQLEQEILPQLDGIVYTTALMQSTIAARIPAITQVPAIVLPCFITPQSAPPSVAIQGDLINIGTLETRKNQSYLLRVLAEAKQLGKRYTLTLIGAGADAERLQQLSHDLKIADQITFLGFQAHASSFLSSHRIYVHSATFESFGIVLIEAMAAGIPIVAAPVGGIPEVFSEGVEGFYWSFTDPIAAAQVLIRLMENDALREQMAKAARTRFLERFETGVVVHELLSFFQQIHPLSKVPFSNAKLTLSNHRVQ